MITRADSIGGAQVHVLELSRTLRRAGVDVTVLTGPGGPFSDELGRSGVPHREARHLVRAISPWMDWLAYREIAQALRDLRPDLVMLHSSKAGWLGRLACRRMDVPVVFTAHGWAFTEGTNPFLRECYRAAERMAGGWADRVIAVSEYDRRLAIRCGIVDEAAIVTVRNGVEDCPLPLADAMRQPARIVVVARMDAQKDHDLLLRALAGLVDVPWTLELIGDGPHRAAIEELARELRLGPRVAFLGARKDVAERLSEAQLFVLPSRWEGLPRSILEAMRAGLPVIASDVGGVSECVEHGVTGYCVPRGSLDEMTQRISALLQAPAQRAAMGAAGRAAYERQFTRARMLDETLAVLSDVLERRGRTCQAKALAALAGRT